MQGSVTVERQALFCNLNSREEEGEGGRESVRGSQDTGAEPELDPAAVL